MKVRVGYWFSCQYYCAFTFVGHVTWPEYQIQFDQVQLEWPCQLRADSASGVHKIKFCTARLRTSWSFSCNSLGLAFHSISATAIRQMSLKVGLQSAFRQEKGSKAARCVSIGKSKYRRFGNINRKCTRKQGQQLYSFTKTHRRKITWNASAKLCLWSKLCVGVWLDLPHFGVRIIPGPVRVGVCKAQKLLYHEFRSRTSLWTGCKTPGMSKSLLELNSMYWLVFLAIYSKWTYQTGVQSGIWCVFLSLSLRYHFNG